MKFFYFAATTTMKVLLVSLTRWHVEGKDNVPRQGPLIVISNHLNLIDPPLLSASVPRDIVFMAKEELFLSRGGPFVRAFGAFPVKRKGLDAAALRHALKVLDAGGVLGMFPEGKRSGNCRLGDAEAGVSFIAGRSGAPILPVAITGSQEVRGFGFVLQRPRIRVAIGRPFTLPGLDGKRSRSQMQEMTAFTMKKIAELLPPQYRGTYAQKMAEVV